jgi:hypothetical protein
MRRLAAIRAMTSFGLIAGAGSAPHGASGAGKRNVGWEARNKLNVAAPSPERRLINSFDALSSSTGIDPPEDFRRTPG